MMASGTVNGGSSHKDEVDLFHLRTAYSSTIFTEDDLVSQSNPVEQFCAWFKDALDCEQITEANAVCLSTSTKEGRPSNRMVLLKDYSDRGFTFFSNYESRKGRELEENPFAAMLFYWPPLHRQVRLEGRVERIPQEQSVRYFSKRPLGSQVSSTVSPQSSKVASRVEVQEKYDALMRTCSENDTKSLERPHFWGGYLLVPLCFEFWQGQSNRLHDRIIFSRDEDRGSWTVSRLWP